MPHSAVHHLEGPYRRFWFPATRGFGIGVTACTELEAAMLANSTLPH